MGTAAMGTAALAAAAPAPEVPSEVVKQNDAAVERYLPLQDINPSSRWFGSMPDSTGLYHSGSASAIVNILTASYVSPQSRYHRKPEVLERIRHAAKFLDRAQSPDGNISLLTTNFNSPPDTGFVVWNVAEAASVARQHKAPEIERALQPFLQKAGRGMATGGIHTPNHRWVVSSALSQIHALWPDDRYVKRIDQWLAEGIDIDEDGQYNERSTTVYNGVTNRALTTLALKLNRPQLLEPVRRNIEAMLYLLHADGEVVTEISRRQDANERGDMARYWFPLRTLAIRDRDGRFAALTRKYEPRYASLPTLLDHPDIAGALPASAPLPDNFEKVFPVIQLARFRRGETSASILLGGTSRFFTLRHGDAVIEALRFSAAFFGKGQFVPTEWAKEGSSYVLKQKLEAGYYQPLDPPEKVAAAEWRDKRGRRKVTELCRLEQSATITPTAKGFRVRMQSKGTDGIPLTVELGLREGAQVEGAESIAGGNWVADAGAVTYRRKGSTMKIGPGRDEHRYVVVRGAETPLPGPKLFLTGFTPFDQTLEFEL